MEKKGRKEKRRNINRRKEKKAKPLWPRVNLKKKKKKKRSSSVEQEVSLEFKERKPSSLFNP